MSDLLTELIPLNLLEEKAKFFADFSYNPQFVYSRDFSHQELTAWGLPKEELVEHSKKMLDQHQMVTTPPSPFITQEYIEEEIAHFNDRYPLESPIEVHFSANQVSRCRINGHHIYFQLPISYTTEKFADLCRHELETHVLRRINHEKNFPSREIHEIMFRRTEEGLAGTHTFILREHKVVFKSYHTYSAVQIAQQGSFADVFSQLKQFKLSDNLAWTISLRTKRGLTDSSQPGGLTKDICYLEGMIQVIKWIESHPEDVESLYWGRLSLDEINELRNQGKSYPVLLPNFFSDMKTYLKNIQKISEVNNFSLIRNF